MRGIPLLVLRILLAVLGGYALAARAVALAAALLAGVVPRGEGFGPFAIHCLAPIVWAVAESRFLRLALVTPAGAWGCSALATPVGRD